MHSQSEQTGNMSNQHHVDRTSPSYQLGACEVTRDRYKEALERIGRLAHGHEKSALESIRKIVSDELAARS